MPSPSLPLPTRTASLGPSCEIRTSNAEPASAVTLDSRMRPRSGVLRRAFGCLVVDAPEGAHTQRAGQRLDPTVTDAADEAVGVHGEARLPPPAASLPLGQGREVLVVPRREPQGRGRAVSSTEHLVGLPIGLDHQAGPQFQRIVGGMACGGLVEPGDVGEVAEVADLEQAVET